MALTLLRTVLLYWLCPHSARSRLYETVRCPSVRLSVPAWADCRKAAAIGLLLWAVRQEISIDCCSSGMRMRAVPLCQRKKLNAYLSVLRHFSVARTCHYATLWNTCCIHSCMHIHLLVVVQFSWLTRYTKTSMSDFITVGPEFTRSAWRMQPTMRIARRCTALLPEASERF